MGDGAGSAGTPDVESSFDDLLDDLEFAVADEPTTERLGLVGATAAIQVMDREDLVAFLSMTKDDVSVSHERRGEPDIELFIPAELVHRFWDTKPAMSIVAGEMTYTGQVRRLLQIVPVLRARARVRHSDSAKEAERGSEVSA